MSGQRRQVTVKRWLKCKLKAVAQALLRATCGPVLVLRRMMMCLPGSYGFSMDSINLVAHDED